MTAKRTAPFFLRFTGSEEPDAELVRRYASSRDAGAFETLVRRHGALVFGICRRTLGSAHDAEDAFQAAFLVLAKKAGRIREPHLLSSWLYGVAVRVANKARVRSARRREETRAHVPERAANADESDRDLGPMIDAELAALPDWQRQAVLLCDVQELSRADAAATLGIPEGTLSSRLASGRKRLAARLARRGIAPAFTLSASVASAHVPEVLIHNTVDTAAAWAAGGPVAAPVAELAREGFSMMRKLAFLSGGAAMATALGLGLAGDPEKPKPMPPDAKVPPAIVERPVAPKLAPAVAPRQRGIVEVSNRYQSIRWSPDGRTLLLTGVDPRSQGNQFGTVSTAVAVVRTDEGRPRAGGESTFKGNILGLNPKDASSYILHLEETGGINVQNKLQIVKASNKEVLGEVELSDPAALEPTLSTDGRTVLFTTYDEATRSHELREIDLATGKLERPAFRTEQNLAAIGVDGSLAVTTRHITRKTNAEPGGGPPQQEEVQHLYDLTVWSARANKKLWTWMPAEKIPYGEAQAVLSHDLQRVAVATSSQIQVFDAVSGREVRKYTATANRLVSEALLSHDGRLTVIVERPAKVAALGEGGGAGLSGEGGSAPPAAVPWLNYVTVLDNASGQAIRKWETQLNVTMAFAPDRPTLAILERPANGPAPALSGLGGATGGMMMGGDGGSSRSARLGLWDFSVAN
jgi:RNA polymerase sigma factor (sigma-70 family)